MGKWVLLMICLFLRQRVVPSLGNDEKNNKTDEILYKKQNWMMAVQLMNVAAIEMPVDEVSLTEIVTSIIGFKSSSWIAQEYTRTAI